jgi:hypothetical protein
VALLVPKGKSNREHKRYLTSTAIVRLLDQFGPIGGVGRRLNVQNEPNSRRRRLAAEETVRNEAKFRGTGVCAQRSLSYGGLVRRGKCAEQSQFREATNGAKRCLRKGLGEKWQMRVRPKTKPIWPSGLRAGTVPMSPGGAFVVCPSGHDQETPYGVTTSAGAVQEKANLARDGVWALGAFGV